MRNKGSIMLARTGRTQQEIADIVGATHQAAHQWKSGATRPSKVRRGEMQAAFGIPVDAWDEQPAGAPEIPVQGLPPAPSQGVGSSAPEVERLPATAIGKMELVEETIMGQLAKVRADPLSTPAEICKVGRDCMAALDIIAKRRGEGGIDMQKWLRSADWTKMLRALERALTGHPEAAAAVEREFLAAEGDER